MESIRFKTKEQLENELKEKISSAYQYAMTFDNYEEKLAELRMLRKEQLSGLNTEQQGRYQLLKSEIAKLEVLVPSIIEYQTVLDLLGLPQETRDSILNHENAHASMAQQVQSQSLQGFRIRFHKDKDGEISFTPSVKTNTDMNFPEKQRLVDDILVTEAPLHYGDTLSKSDIRNIEEVQEKLKALEARSQNY